MFKSASISNQFVLLVAAFTLFSCSSEKEGPKTMPPQEYPVQTIEKVSFTSLISYPVAIEGEQNVELRPKIQGFIETIYVNEGDYVKQGQLLFKLNAQEYNQQILTAEAKVAVEASKVELAKMEVDKQKPLVEKKIVSEIVLKSAELALKSAEASLLQAKAEVQSAKTNYDYCNIKSPINGVIGMIPYNIGSLVNSSITMPLTQITNIKNVRAYFSVNEKDYIQLSKSLEDSATNNHLILLLADKSEYEHLGKIDAVSGIINAKTGSITIRASFPNPKEVLKNGSSGVVKIPISYTDVVVVPQSATFDIQNKRFVYVVNTENKVIAKEITALPDDSGQLFIVSDGLNANDIVVSSGISSLQNEMEIIPVATKK